MKPEKICRVSVLLILAVMSLCVGIVSMSGLDADLSDIETSVGNTYETSDYPHVTVTYPNGGEVWYVGHTYTITWTTEDPDNDLLRIFIWFSGDSGNTWVYKIADDVPNTGSYDWTIPSGHPELCSVNCRIKVWALGPCSRMGWDISDEDFCPLEEPDLTLNVAEDPVEGELDLLWDVAIEGGLAVELPGYNVYKSETDGSNYQPTATPSINCYSDGEVTTGVIYFYKVTALDSEGNESQPSNEANGLAP